MPGGEEAPAVRLPAVTLRQRITLFEPKGQTKALLEKMNVVATRVDATSDLSAHDALVIGKEALTADGFAPDLTRVREA